MKTRTKFTKVLRRLILTIVLGGTISIAWSQSKFRWRFVRCLISNYAWLKTWASTRYVRWWTGEYARQLTLTTLRISVAIWTIISSRLKRRSHLENSAWPNWRAIALRPLLLKKPGNRSCLTNWIHTWQKPDERKVVSPFNTVIQPRHRDNFCRPKGDLLYLRNLEVGCDKRSASTNCTKHHIKVDALHLSTTNASIQICRHIIYTGKSHQR